jgi:hypothetical protein
MSDLKRYEKQPDGSFIEFNDPYTSYSTSYYDTGMKLMGGIMLFSIIILAILSFIENCC